MEKDNKVSCLVCKKNSFFYTNKFGYDVYGCAGCGLKFVWPIPKNLHEIYGKNYFYDEKSMSGHGYTSYDDDKDSMKIVFETELSKLEKNVYPRNIFDIGTATGYFLNIAKARGWNTSGSEISVWAGEVARQRGHKIFLGSLLDYDCEDLPNIVTMWDVLEHVDDPEAYIRKINALLPVAGIFIINTIDSTSRWASLLGTRWNMLLPPEHLFYFSQKCLQILLERNGFKIIEQKRLTKKFSLPYIFKIMYNWTGVKLFEKFSYFFNNKFWRYIQIPINIRDNIFLKAKKVKDVSVD